jgi:asparagine synthase (glutamine-hydrolysing)
MCGIAGILSLKGHAPDERVLAQMVDVIRHRGPDDNGYEVVGPCGLGNTRLAVIDLSAAGHQPMRVIHTPTKELDLPPYEAWIAYNGEVYNFAEVRAYLEATRHNFFSQSDTETILRAYIQYGAPNFIKAFRGMFALAIWDVRRQRLILARDRVGEKPLYYYMDSEWLVWGSEIKSLLKHSAVPTRLNEALVPHYLAYGYAPAPETMFEGIQQLAPGHMMIVDLASGTPQITIEPYWEAPYPVTDADDRSEDEIASELLEQLRSAVVMRMIADVPLGAFLSGGLDSAAIVALMAQESRRAIKTFAIGFENEPSYDETRYARQVATRFVTDHHEFIVKPDVIELADELVWHHDQPFGDSSAIPTYLVSKLAREHVTVALTGDGGDELFAGYDRFKAAQLAETFDLIPDAAYRAIESALDLLPESTNYGGIVRRANRFVQAATLPLSERYLSWIRYVSSEWVKALAGEAGEARVQNHYRECFGGIDERSGDDVVARLLDVNLRTYLPEDLLVKTDRASMAVALEARAPFLDHMLVQFAAGIPTSLKLKRGTSKHILKKALRGILPNSIIDRKKHGFGVPMGAWFRGDLASYAHQTLLGEKAMRRGIFSSDAVKQMLAAHTSGQADLGQSLWTLLTFELWMQRYFD